VTGLDHDRTFEVAAIIAERRYPPATGSSKKVAEQRAARNALKILESELDVQDASGSA
jgi:ribonuclease-3